MVVLVAVVVVLVFVKVVTDVVVSPFLVVTVVTVVAVVVVVLVYVVVVEVVVYGSLKEKGYFVFLSLPPASLSASVRVIENASSFWSSSWEISSWITEKGASPSTGYLTMPCT